MIRLRTIGGHLSSLTRDDGLKAQLVRGAVGVGGLKLLSLPLTLVTSILLALGLGPEGYGQFSFIMAVITMLSLPVGKGLGQLITREVARYHHGAEWGLFRGLLRRAHQWVILGSAVIAAVIALLATTNTSWAADDRWTLLLVATFLLPLLGLNEIRSATLRGLSNVFYAQIPELLARPGLHLIIVSSLLVSCPTSTQVSLSAYDGRSFPSLRTHHAWQRWSPRCPPGYQRRRA